MTNIEKYINAFTEALEVKEDQAEWDSVGHMTLVSAIEEAFDIMMDTEDIIDFSSYEKGKEILSNNYGVAF